MKQEINNNNRKWVQAHSGMVLVNVLIFATIAVTVTTGLVNWGATVLKTTRTLDAREQAFQVAEAGIEYYRWHLAHAPTDYQDGTGAPGPYVHTVLDADGDMVGSYSLTITPPATGSTIVRVRSTGTVVVDPSISRTIQATLAIPSLAKYAVVANAAMRFGEGTEVFGPIHSNAGIRFDGLAHNIVTSGVASYDDPDHDESGSERLEYGVHTHVAAPPGSGVNDSYRPAEMPPATPPNRADVFMAGRQFPVPTFDFTGLTTDLSAMKSNAQASGRYYAHSGSQGYHIVLKTNDTYDLYRVNSLRSAPNNCTNTANQTNWGTWSVNSQTLIASNQTFPANGIIFLEDHVWVDGTINGARLTIASGRFPDNVTTRTDITINDDLLYTNYDGTDVISLIAQRNINVGLWSQDDLRIDAALVAQNGRAGRWYYENDCRTTGGGGQNYYVRNQLTLYGMIATNERYGFAYTDDTGYTNRDIIYDSNLLYGPPPSFPLTSSQYTTISWQEI
ncbi:MAG: hypothetical protein AAB365_02415 [Patescibacteria group bacterium]